MILEDVFTIMEKMIVLLYYVMNVTLIMHALNVMIL